TFGDAVGANPTLTWAQLNALGITGPASLANLRVAVSDGHSHTVTASTNLTVNNVAPTLSNIRITPSVSEGGQATLAGTIIDPGTQDTFTLVVDWGDDSSPQTFSLTATNSTTTPFSLTHTFTATGTLSVGLTVTDSD